MVFGRSRYSILASLSFVFASGGLLVACARQPAVETARAGDWKGLLATIEGERKAGKLNANEIRALAEGSLEGAVLRSSGARGVDFVSGLRSCAEPLEDALRERAEKRDATGGEAALVLLERNAWCGDSPQSFATAEDGAWRALAAHEADGESDGEERRRFLVDPDERVRRAAVEAALAAKSAKDLAILIEASRVEPDPWTRSRALRAVGALGGENVGQVLRDRFQSADDEAGRLAVLDAWAEKATFEAGGRGELLRVAEHESGYVALAASATFLRAEPVDRVEAEEGARAFARLATASERGSEGERRLALRLLPAEHPRTEALLLTASKDADEEVALIATVRLAARPKHQKEAEKRLLSWARGKGSLRLEARSALAVYGTKEVLPLLTAELKSKDARERLLAGRSLVRSGALIEVAPLLADTDPSVRYGIACTLLEPARTN